MIIHCDENGRQGKARNIGLQYSSASWIAYIDSDDWVEPDYFEKLYSIALQAECDIVACHFVRDYSKELSFLSDRTTGKSDRYMLIDNEILFPENLTYEDTYFSSLLHLYVEKVYFLEEKLYHYFVNEHSTVLQIDSEHHLDLLTVQIILWNEWKKRGFLELFKEELEYDFLYSCYLRFLKIIIYRYQIPSFSLFSLLQNLINERIQDYSKNLYIQQIEQPEFYQILFQAISLPMNKNIFNNFIDQIKKIGF